MIRFAPLLLFVALSGLPVWAQDTGHSHDPHVAALDGLRVLHAWTPATDTKGALIYMEIENGTKDRVTLDGADTADGQTVELVGFAYTDGIESWQGLGAMPIDPGQHLDLEPRRLALRLIGLKGPIAEGDEIEIDVTFGDRHLDVHVAVEAADAVAHGHAGHGH